MNDPRPSVAEKRRAFQQLHEQGCFIIPNPWDAGSARLLQSLGFKALATTSAGFAWSLGRPDNGAARDKVLAHLTEIVAATDIPVNADFENGFAETNTGLAESVRLAVQTGIAGLSIEDATGNPNQPLLPMDVACQRIGVARNTIDRAGADVLLVARAECFVVGKPDLGETIARLKAYAQMGADCLYAPGIYTRDQIQTVVAVVHPKPVNLLVNSAKSLSMAEIAELGVRRISVGGALACAAWGGFMRAARGLAEHGSFEGFANAVTGKELNTLFGEASAVHQPVSSYAVKSL